MATLREQAMQAYWSRDADRLQQLLAAAELELTQLRAYVTGQPAGPSSEPSHTGRNDREIALADRLGKG